MATNKAQIFNFALTLLGQASISDPDGSGVNETACRQVYDIVRQSLLEEHLWNFAIRRSTPATNATAPDFEYSYSFDIPSDCLRIHKLYNHTGAYKEEDGKILSDSDTLYLIYIKDVTDVPDFPPLFAKLLAIDVALAVEYRITNQSKMQGSLIQQRQQTLIKAKMVDAQKDGETKQLVANTEIAMSTPYGNI